MKRNKFSLSHYKLLTCDMGEIVPCGLVEVLPGDTFQHATSGLIRCSPLLAPVMHPVHVRFHSFFVPHRLVWEDWEDFITGGPDGMDDSEFPTITIGSGGAAVGSLADYLGVPTGVDNIECSALPFRGYALIFNEWFRDQDLVSPLALSVASGADAVTNTSLTKAAWGKDYFTSARPWTQKGPAVTIPLTGDAPVIGIGKGNQTFPNATQSFYESDGTLRSYTASANINSSSANTQFAVEEGSTGYPNVRADLSGVSAVNVSDLRLALALQRWEEARARWGSRYTEYLRYYGVKSSDARLQRPELLNAGRQTIQFSEILQTANDTDEGETLETVGTMRGHGIAPARSRRYLRFFEEHGYVFTFMSVLPVTMYIQGLPRTWNRRTKEDFWQRELEAIGQQEVLNKELYAAHSSPDGVFGYQDRYDEYRRNESWVSGEFRNSSLDFWHMARNFSGEPSLNASFVTSTPTKRNFAVQDEDVLWCMVRHSIQARRMVSKTGRSFIL